MTIKQIRYFITAYELQNIAKAADQLFVSRPVISRALSDLDREAYRPALKAEGFLTRDSREVERKKPGQPGARARFQFSKR